MATVRQWLDEAGFDWENGMIVYQPVTADSLCPGWGEVAGAEVVTSEHPILDEEFHTGYGAPQCPRFVARDTERIFFPGECAGATFLHVVEMDIRAYLDWQRFETPYPGGD